MSQSKIITAAFSISAIPVAQPQSARILRRHRSARAAILLVAGLFAPLYARAATNFDSTNFSANALPVWVAKGDFNNDGVLDLVAANQTFNAVSVMLGNGDGTMDAPTLFDVGSQPQSVAVGDFNGDNNADLAVSNFASANVSVLLGDGTGNFSVAVNYPSGGGGFVILLGDFNGDGCVDLAIGDCGTDTVEILLGNCNGTFGAPTGFPVGDTPTSATVGDFNGDGKLDIATANFNSNNVSVLLGNGAGSFAAATTFAVGANPTSIAVNDMDSDGDADLAVANFNDFTVSVLLGDGSGDFGAETNFATQGNPNSVVAADITGDGRPDVVTASESGTISLLKGDGAGGLGGPSNFPAGSSPRIAVVGDFNGDGLEDIATGNVNSSNVTVLLQVFTPVDAAFSGVTNFAVGTSPRSVATGDFNRDGIADLVTSNFNGNDVSVTLGDGLGSFAAAESFAAGAGPYGVAVGDFNRDGKDDLVATNYYTATISVQLGDGLGGFGALGVFSVGSSPYSVAVGDFNGDRMPDLACANNGSNNVSVLIGNGAGGFAPAVPFTAGTDPHWIIVEDLNGDGNSDLAVANYSSANISVLIGNGAGSFAAPSNFGAGSNPSAVVAGDFDGDGKLDLAVGNYGSLSVSLLIGNGAGSFASPTNLPVGASLYSIATGDLNGDGNLDLTAAISEENKVAVLLGDGMGSFGAPGFLGTGTNPGMAIVEDFNRDGKTDLVASNYGSNNVTVVLNAQIHSSLKYDAPVNFAAGSFPHSIASGDFNGDGKADLVTANEGPNSVSVSMGDGMGGFGASVEYGADNTPNAVAVGDLDGDGHPDLVTANYGSANISVLLNDGVGGFDAAVNYGVGDKPFSVSAADLDRDGDADLVVASYESSKVYLLIGDGSGVFSPAVDITGGTGPVSVAVGDFNRDGAPDLAAANFDSGNVSIFLAAGAGGFGVASNFTVGSNPFSVAVGDFNRDGKADLATANYGSHNVSVLIGNGAGSFAPAVHYAAGSSCRSVAVGDLNGDGRDDLAVANEASDNVSVLLGFGIGVFAPAVNYPAGDGSSSIAIADFDSDGSSDLATANYFTGDFSVLKNIGGQFSLDTTSVAPASISNSATHAILKIVAAHRVIAGETADYLQLSSFDLGFTDGAGAKLTASQAGVLLAGLSVWLDNGSGVFEAGSDTEICRVTHLDLDGRGRLRIQLPATADTQFASGNPKTYFISVQAAANASTRTPNTLKITHFARIGGSTAIDPNAFVPLKIESTPDFTSASTIFDSNVAPTNIGLSGTRHINENSPNGTLVGNLTTVDPDAGNTFTYTFAAPQSSADGRFGISGAQLQTANSSLLNYESATNHIIQVRSTDQGGLFVAKVFTIAVDNVNEAPTDIALSNAGVNENAVNGTLVGNLSTADPDAGGSFSYAFLAPEANAGGRFAIAGAQLNVGNGSLLNFETSASWNVRIRSTGSGGLQINKLFAISVSNVNEAPTNIGLGGARNVIENAANGTAIGDFNTYDPDAGNTFVYTFAGPESNAGGRFAAVGAQLQVLNGALLNYETATSHKIHARSTDQGGLTTDKLFTVVVANVNEAPTNIGLSGGRSVAEGAVNGANIGTLTTTDSDRSETFAYAFAAPQSNAGGRFQIVGAQFQVANGQLLNYEANVSHAVRIRSTDFGGLTTEKQFTIMVTDVVNEAPTNIALSGPRTVAENAPNDTVVGDLTTSHPGGGSTFVYTFIAPENNAGGRFKVVGGQLKVANSTLLDYEAKSSHAIRIRATDQNNLFTDKVFTITLIDGPG